MARWLGELPKKHISELAIKTWFVGRLSVRLSVLSRYKGGNGANGYSLCRSTWKIWTSALLTLQAAWKMIIRCEKNAMCIFCSNKSFGCLFATNDGRSCGIYANSKYIIGWTGIVWRLPPLGPLIAQVRVLGALADGPDEVHNEHGDSIRAQRNINNDE